jgi:glycerol-3-phosphate acyltransferase PlsY
VTYALLVLSYLVGATPTSYLVGKGLHGVDLREHGSGNLGATNAFRVLGWRSALPVMIVDVAKGFVPVSLFPRLAGAGFSWTLAFGAAAILGHMFSVWVRFRGGKGVATSAGVFLALAPGPVGAAAIVWALVVAATRYVSLGSILAAVTLPVFVALWGHGGGRGLVGFTVALAAAVVWAHRSNLRRLLNGEESRIGGAQRREAGG